VYRPFVSLLVVMVLIWLSNRGVDGSKGAAVMGVADEDEDELGAVCGTARSASNCPGIR
jgi:hypothetical protein